MTPGSVCSIRLICSRVMIRMTHPGGTTVTELSLSEAKQVRELLDRAIAGLEAGYGFTGGLDDLIAALNHP